jgi:hypothetical protein
MHQMSSEFSTAQLHHPQLHLSKKLKKLTSSSVLKEISSYQLGNWWCNHLASTIMVFLDPVRKDPISLLSHKLFIKDIVNR